MFSQNYGKAVNAYRSVGVESIANSASSHQLVLMLFKGARAAVAAANGHMQRREIPAKCKAITSAIEIIDGGLKASLDLNVGGPLAKNLSDLYAYMTQRLFLANLKNDRSALEEVGQLLEQLSSAWEAIAEKPALTQPAATSPTAHQAPASSDAPASPSRPNRVAAAYGAV